MIDERGHYTENVAFNDINHEELQLILCLSSPVTTRAYNEQVEYIEQTGRIADIGDAHIQGLTNKGPYGLCS